jgi:hypothetical protein
VRLSKKDSHLFLQQSEFLEKYATAALERPACRIRRYSYSKLEDLDALAPFLDKFNCGGIPFCPIMNRKIIPTA